MIELTRILLIILYAMLLSASFIGYRQFTRPPYRVLAAGSALVCFAYLGFYIYTDIADPALTTAVQLSRVVQLPAIGLIASLLFILRDNEQRDKNRRIDDIINGR